MNVESLASEVLKQVEEVCGLRLREAVDVRGSKRPAPPLPEVNDPEDHKLSEEEMRKDMLRTGGIEVLGRYRAESRDIRVYTKSCKLFADQAAVPRDDVELIVLIHELAHAVHHGGMFRAEERKSDPGDWIYFGNQCHVLLERLAQESTMLVIGKHYRNRPTLWETFKEMSRLSPPRYRNWGAHNEATLNEEILQKSEPRKVTADLLVDAPVDS